MRYLVSTGDGRFAADAKARAFNLMPRYNSKPWRYCKTCYEMMYASPEFKARLRERQRRYRAKARAAAQAGSK